MASQQQFRDAVKRLVGEVDFEKMCRAGLSVSAMCKEVAERYFLDKTLPGASQELDLAIVKMVALRLWYGDGTHGLKD